MILRLFAFLLLASPGAAAAMVALDQVPIDCGNCAELNQPQAPFRIFGNTYYVGTHGLSSVLIVTSGGLILLDGDLPQSAQQISDNITTLGFRMRDLHWILNSHAQMDQAGGIAALARMSGANVAASVLAAQALRAGALPMDDPQSDGGNAVIFPKVSNVHALLDDAKVTLGDVTVTAHYTPGHSPGGTTWTWHSCEGRHCVDVVYADSLDPASAGDFRYSGTARNPTTADILRNSIARVRALPCDVIISAHPDATGVFEKAAANAHAPLKNAFLDRSACGKYADDSEQLLDARLNQERTGIAH